jgi:hypothetical protein
MCVQGEPNLKLMRDFALSQLPEDHVVNLRRADTVQVSRYLPLLSVYTAVPL